MTVAEEANPSEDSAFQAFGLRLLKEKKLRQAAEAERDSWKEEALSLRRRLGIPQPNSGRRPRVADIPDSQTTESVTGSGSDEKKEDDMSKKDINAQPVAGGRLGPAEPTMRKAATPELPATSVSDDVQGSGLNVGTPRVDSMGRSLGAKGGRK